LWRDGKAIDLGNLGRNGVNWAFEINDRGEIVGFSGGAITGHAFLWEHSKMRDLGVFPGDIGSESEGISPDGNLLVGGSCHGPGDTYNCRAVIWHHGVIEDMNKLIPAGSPLRLVNAVGNPNARGQIVGNAVVKSTKQIHAFLATPCDAENPDHQGCNAARRTESPVVLPANVRALLQRMNARRFGAWPMR
jgi:probable HAF family extracellular repeat protein